MGTNLFRVGSGTKWHVAFLRTMKEEKKYGGNTHSFERKQKKWIQKWMEENAWLWHCMITKPATKKWTVNWEKLHTYLFIFASRQFLLHVMIRIIIISIPHGANHFRWGKLCDDEEWENESEEFEEQLMATVVGGARRLNILLPFCVSRNCRSRESKWNPLL